MVELGDLWRSSDFMPELVHLDRSSRGSGFWPELSFLWWSGPRSNVSTLHASWTFGRVNCGPLGVRGFELELALLGRTPSEFGCDRPELGCSSLSICMLLLVFHAWFFMHDHLFASLGILLMSCHIQFMLH